MKIPHNIISQNMSGNIGGLNYLKITHNLHFNVDLTFSIIDK